MRFHCLFAFLFLLLNISCSRGEDSDLDPPSDMQEYLIQALEGKMSIQSIEHTTGSYRILFSDNNVYDLPKSKKIFYTTIGHGNNWFISGTNTNIQAESNPLNSRLELLSLDVDDTGRWSINEKRTNIQANMSASNSDNPLIKNIVETPRFFYFYFSDRTLIRFVNKKNNGNPDYRKQILPSKPGALKILCVGNSFTNDAVLYLPSIIQSAGLKNIVIGAMIKGGISLDRQYKGYVSNSPDFIYMKTDGQMKWQTVSNTYPLKEALMDESWDIVTFQQVSADAGRYQTYQPYLTNLIKIAKNHCKNPKVIIGWQMTWAFATGFTEESFGKYGYDQLKMYKAITKATKLMMNDSDVDIVIPVGTTIQNLRKTGLNNPPLDITVDNRHLDYGAGRYAAACTLFQTLIAPCYDTDLHKTTFVGTFGNIFVTEKNYKICQQAAVSACNDPYNITALAN